MIAISWNNCKESKKLHSKQTYFKIQTTLWVVSNSAVHEKVATSNSHPDWKRLCQHARACITLIRQKLMIWDEHDIHHDMALQNRYTPQCKRLWVHIIEKIRSVSSQITLIDCCQTVIRKISFLLCLEEAAKRENIPNILYMSCETYHCGCLIC